LSVVVSFFSYQWIVIDNWRNLNQKLEVKADIDNIAAGIAHHIKFLFNIICKRFHNNDIILDISN